MQSVSVLLIMYKELFHKLYTQRRGFYNVQWGCMMMCEWCDTGASDPRQDNYSTENSFGNPSDDVINKFAYSLKVLK